jgi:hypothetical protein
MPGGRRQQDPDSGTAANPPLARSVTEHRDELAGSYGANWKLRLEAAVRLETGLSGNTAGAL